jgi:hypothetical protein
MRSVDNERSGNAGVLAHCEAMPKEGIALTCRRVDRSGMEERHETVKYKMSRSMGRSTSMLAKGAGCLKPPKVRGLVSVSCHLGHRTDRE